MDNLSSQREDFSKVMVLGWLKRCGLVYHGVLIFLRPFKGLEAFRRLSFSPIIKSK